jgi:hypothetical protein
MLRKKQLYESSSTRELTGREKLSLDYVLFKKGQRFKIENK